MIHQTQDQINKSLKIRQQKLDQKWRTGNWSNEPQHRIQERLDKNIRENRSLAEFR